MRVIKQRLSLLMVISSLGLLADIFVLYLDSVKKGPLFNPAIFLVILLSVILLGFLIREYRTYKIARLIVENKIMHIAAAHIESAFVSNNNSNNEGIEVFISCFGILLDSMVIKFNIDGIKLKEVQIGSKFIYLSYGTEKNNSKNTDSAWHFRSTGTTNLY